MLKDVEGKFYRPQSLQGKNCMVGPARAAGSSSLSFGRNVLSTSQLHCHCDGRSCAGSLGFG